MWLDFDVRDNRRCTFSLEEALLWIMDSYFGQKELFEVKSVLIMDLFLPNTQLLSSQDVNWWTGGVDYLWIIVMFLSAVWTLILTAPIHCRGSFGEQVMEWYISTNLMKKQTNEWTEWGHFHFRVNQSSNTWFREWPRSSPGWRNDPGNTAWQWTGLSGSWRRFPHGSSCACCWAARPRQTPRSAGYRHRRPERDRPAPRNHSAAHGRPEPFRTKP